MFLNQLGLELSRIYDFWLNGSSGKWKWIKSGKEFTFTDWAPTYPLSMNDYDHLYVKCTSSITGAW
jgi:hypothetical protein